MTLLIDTSVLLAGGPDLGTDPWSVSVITIGELTAGILLAESGAERALRTRRMAGLLRAVHVLPVDADVAARFGELRALSGRRPSNDLWIAATAVARALTLVTADRGMASLPGVRTRLVELG